MKKINILYWISTILFAGYMIFTAIPDVVVNDQAIMVMHETLGYPIYIISFIGIAKLLGSITLLVPGLTRLKEWAYAGLFFDLIGATYSLMIMLADAMTFVIMLLPMIVGALSYYFHHKRLKAKAQLAN